MSKLLASGITNSGSLRQQPQLTEVLFPLCKRSLVLPALQLVTYSEILQAVLENGGHVRVNSRHSAHVRGIPER